MSCTADPGRFCSPLYNRPMMCPENWYCPGGISMARRCPDNRWSAVGSKYPEDCVEHMNVQLAVVVVLFFILPVLCVCIWFASWGWMERDRKTGPESYFGQIPYTEPYYPIVPRFCDVQPGYSSRCNDAGTLYSATKSTYP